MNMMLKRAVLLALVAPAAHAGAWKPERRPTSSPVTSRTTSAELTQITTAGGTLARHVASVRTLTLAVAPAPQGLAVELATRDAAVDVDGVRAVAGAGAPLKFRMQSTGEVSGAAPDSGLGLVLPARPVAPGDTWQSDAPGSAESPVPVHTTY